MFLLALHIVSIGILIMVVWSIAFARGRRAGERQLRRRLEWEAQAGAQGGRAETPSHTAS